MKIILVGFLPDDHGCHCEAHPYGCGNAFIEKEGSGVSSLVCLRLIKKMHLAGHEVQGDGSDGSHVCFAAREYANWENAHVLDGAVVRITRLVIPDCENKSLRELYHHNCGYANVETVEN